MKGRDIVCWLTVILFLIICTLLNACSYSSFLFFFLFLFSQVKGIEFFRFPLHKDPSLSLITFIVLLLFPCNILPQQGLENIKYSYEYRFSILFLRHLNMSISTNMSISPGDPAIAKMYTSLKTARARQNRKHTPCITSTANRPSEVQPAGYFGLPPLCWMSQKWCKAETLTHSYLFS